MRRELLTNLIVAHKSTVFKAINGSRELPEGPGLAGRMRGEVGLPDLWISNLHSPASGVYEKEENYNARLGQA